MLNWIILIGGLLAISLFWHFNSPKERMKETHIVSATFTVLGVLVYFLQTL